MHSICRSASGRPRIARSTRTRQQPATQTALRSPPPRPATACAVAPRPRPVRVFLVLFLSSASCPASSLLWPLCSITSCSCLMMLRPSATVDLGQPGQWRGRRLPDPREPAASLADRHRPAAPAQALGGLNDPLLESLSGTHLSSNIGNCLQTNPVVSDLAAHQFGSLNSGARVRRFSPWRTLSVRILTDVNVGSDLRIRLHRHLHL